jgi:hypothetical protein
VASATPTVLVELDLYLRVHDSPDAEVRVKLVSWRVDLDLTGTVHNRELADAAKKRNEPIGEVRIAKKKPHVVRAFAADPPPSDTHRTPSKG